MAKNMMVDLNMVDALQLWVSHGLYPGSCCYLLLTGKYEEAFLHAHELIKPHWADHIKYVESLPAECRGENMDSWKAKIKERR
jgi:hypothetical protein